MDSTNTTDLSEHLDCVPEAAISILAATCGVQATILTEGEADCTDGVIIAVISVVGGVEWSIFIGLPKNAATQLAAGFAGFEISFDSDDMGDAIGELANITAGEVKKLLDARGVHVEISLPSVIRAKDMRVLVQRDLRTKKFCFDSEVGRFWTGVVAGQGGGFVG